MADMEEKLSAVLNNPQLMQQIMTMAQSLGQQATPSPQPQPTPPPQEASVPSLPDPAMLQKLAGLAASTGTDSQQKALLSALGPYLSRDRIHRLEKAMQAAKMARLASAFLSSGALQSLTGR